MNYGDIMKRAWHITWRYKALWVLGIFAGVSGCQGGGGGNYNSSSWRTDSKDLPSGFPSDLGGLDRFAEQAVPVLVAVVLLLALVALVMLVLGIAARGGLIVGASAYEEGRRLSVGELWGAGFGRFGSLLGLWLLLGLPLLVAAVLILVIVLVPLIGVLSAGGDPGPAVFAPICGGLAIGVPVLLVSSFILGVMHLIALRYVMLGGQGAIQAAGNSWRFFRARLKDTVLIWLINAGLNIVASVALAVPAVVIGIAVAIPMVAAISTGTWSAFAGLIALLIVLITVLSLAYNAVWGTYTSALWTCFFRDVAEMPGAAVGLTPPLATGQVYTGPVTPAGFPEQPPAPPAPPMAPPVAPAPPAPPQPPSEPEPPADA